MPRTRPSPERPDWGVTTVCAFAIIFLVLVIALFLFMVRPLHGASLILFMVRRRLTQLSPAVGARTPVCTSWRFSSRKRIRSCHVTTPIPRLWCQTRQPIGQPHNRERPGRRAALRGRTGEGGSNTSSAFRAVSRSLVRGNSTGSVVATGERSRIHYGVALRRRTK